MRNSKATSTALPNSTTQHLAEVAVQENQPRLRRDRHQNSRVRRVMQPAAAEVVPEGSAQTEFPPSMHVAVLLQQLQVCVSIECAVIPCQRQIRAYRP